MEKKLKKHLRILIVRISAILLAVWLILTCAYAVVTYFDEKERAYDDARIAFSNLTEALSLPNNSYSAVDDARKDALTKGRGNGASYGYDPNVDVFILDPKARESIDFDDIINIAFTAGTEDPEFRESHFGYLSYKSFRASMTDDQYEKILSYFNSQPDNDEYYELLCTEFYRNDVSQILPKTLQIVLTRDVYKWYVQDTVVESFELEPEQTEDLTLYHISYLNRNEISEDFLRGEFNSGELIDTAQRMIRDTQEQGTYFGDGEVLLSESLSSYIYYAKTTMTVQLTDFAYEDLLKMEETDSFPDSTTFDKRYDVYYARRLDIFDNCKRNILTASGVLLIFFLIIGVILIVMLWKSLKTQVIEEQKRRDMTNALAHDIKTPLFILSGYADNLRENVQTEKRAHYAEVIVEQAREVNRRVNRMLELSKLDSPSFKLNKQEFDLCEMIAGILLHYEVLPNGKRIESQTDQDRCVIEADRDLMKRAIENLIDNAVKYSDADTAIRIILKDHSLKVVNTCSSADAADFHRMLKPYERADRSRPSGGSAQGTGLGLTIVDTICGLHRMKLSYSVREDTVSFEISLH